MKRTLWLKFIVLLTVVSLSGCEQQRMRIAQLERNNRELEDALNVTQNHVQVYRERNAMLRGALITKQEETRSTSSPISSGGPGVMSIQSNSPMTPEVGPLDESSAIEVAPSPGSIPSTHGNAPPFNAPPFNPQPINDGISTPPGIGSEPGGPGQGDTAPLWSPEPIQTTDIPATRPVARLAATPITTATATPGSHQRSSQPLEQLPRPESNRLDQATPSNPLSQPVPSQPMIIPQAESSPARNQVYDEQSIPASYSPVPTRQMRQVPAPAVYEAPVRQMQQPEPPATQSPPAADENRAPQLVPPGVMTTQQRLGNPRGVVPASFDQEGWRETSRQMNQSNISPVGMTAARTMRTPRPLPCTMEQPRTPQQSNGNDGWQAKTDRE